MQPRAYEARRYQVTMGIKYSEGFANDQEAAFELLGVLLRGSPAGSGNYFLHRNTQEAFVDGAIGATELWAIPDEQGKLITAAERDVEDLVRILRIVRSKA